LYQIIPHVARFIWKTHSHKLAGVQEPREMFFNAKSKDLPVAAGRVTAYPLKYIQTKLRCRRKDADVRLLNWNDRSFEPNVSASHPTFPIVEIYI
jgi:hypothetical protein